MVAPDGAGEKAVVSTFVNERLLGSTVAATGEATHLDLLLPDGLVGTIANVRVVIQRDSAQGDCRFEPQGYPAQILGSSALVLADADATPHDFSDLTSRFSQQLEILLPGVAGDQPDRMLDMVTEVAAQLSPDVAPLAVDFIPGGSAPLPDAALHCGQRYAAGRGRPTGAFRSRPCRRNRPRRTQAPRSRRFCRRGGRPDRRRGRLSRAVDQTVVGGPIDADAKGHSPRSRRCRLRRWQRRGAGDVDRARYRGADFLSGSGLLALRGRTFPPLDHCRPLAVRDGDAASDTATHVPPPAAHAGPNRPG